MYVYIKNEIYYAERGGLKRKEKRRDGPLADCRPPSSILF